MATMQLKIFCIREFIKTAVKSAFRLRSNIQPPTRKSICLWNYQFEQIGCLCKGKSSGRPRVSEENVRRIQESFERSPRKSPRRASREFGIPQPTVWERECNIRHLNPNRNENIFSTSNHWAPLWGPFLLQCVPGCFIRRSMAGVWCW